MAGNKQTIGWRGLTPGPLKIDYGPKGTTSHFTMTVADNNVNALVAYYNYIIQFGASGTFLGCDVGIDGQTSAEVMSLEVSVPGLINNLGNVLTELYFDSWELLTNENTDSIFNNPLIVGSPGGWMTDNDKVVLSYLATNGGLLAEAVAECNYRCNSTPQSLPYPVTGGTGATPSQYQKPSDARSKQIFLEIMKGQVEFSRPGKVLRHTSYCSAGALYNTGIGYEECIYTTPQLLTECGSGWTYSLPPRLYSEIAAQPIQHASAVEAAYYTFGWKKTVGREPVLSNFLVEREVEYVLGLWSNLRYGHR
jgi:hypothetical protein